MTPRRGLFLALAVLAGAEAVLGVVSDDPVSALIGGFGVGGALMLFAATHRRKPPPPPPDPTERLMQAGESLTALYDFAEGQRAELERRGFSPTAAEMVVASWLANGGHS